MAEEVHARRTSRISEAMVTVTASAQFSIRNPSLGTPPS
jgi:hypothetical protein